MISPQKWRISVWLLQHCGIIS